MTDELEGCRESQLTEIGMIEAMYTSSELIFATEIVGGSTYRLLTHFTIKLKLNDKRIDVTVSMPQLYPVRERPTVYIRSHGDFYDKELNTRYKDWIDVQEYNIPLVTQITAWVLDNASSLAVVKGMPTPKAGEKEKEEKYCRLYIKSHHIHSEKKRAFIVKSAKDFKLNGFLFHGRPGIIIVEGKTPDCDEFWLGVKGLNWKKITLMETEELTSEKEFKLEPFKELNLSSSCNVKVLDAGEIKALLVQAGLGGHFNALYGL